MPPQRPPIAEALNPPIKPIISASASQNLQVEKPRKPVDAVATIPANQQAVIKKNKLSGNINDATSSTGKTTRLEHRPSRSGSPRPSGPSSTFGGGKKPSVISKDFGHVKAE